MKASIAGALALLLASPVLAQSRGMQNPPPTNVRLTFHLIEADSFQGDDAEIRPVVTELRKLFRFQGYRLASKSVLNATAWPPSEVSQRIMDPDGHAYIIEARVESSNAIAAMRQDSTAQIVRLSVVLRSADPGQTEAAGNRFVGRTLISASVSLADGKTVVLGSAKPSQESRALILVATPTINP